MNEGNTKSCHKNESKIETQMRLNYYKEYVKYMRVKESLKEKTKHLATYRAYK